MQKRQGKKFLSCQSRSSCPNVLSVLGLSRADFGTDRKKQKTYGRISGMIFWGGAGYALVFDAQHVATQLSRKNRNNYKKSVK
jgi:hypothetical protein